MPTKEELKRWKTVHIPRAMKKLKKAYLEVYNDGYRATGGTGRLGFLQYLKKFDMMLHELSAAVWLVQAQRYYDNNMCDEIGPMEFYHDIHHFIERVRTEGDRRTEDYIPMVVLERYIVQVHRFIDSKNFDRFSVFQRDCYGKWHWWNWQYSDTDKAYVIADEDVDEYAKAYNYKGKSEFIGFGDGNDRLSRNTRSILRRMKPDNWSRDCEHRCFDASRATHRGKKGNPLCSYGGAVVTRCTRKKCPKNNL